jgi:hypothetical protein
VPEAAIAKIAKIALSSKCTSPHALQFNTASNVFNLGGFPIYRSFPIYRCSAQGSQAIKKEPIILQKVGSRAIQIAAKTDRTNRGKQD